MDNIKTLVSDELGLIEKSISGFVSADSDLFEDLKNFISLKSKRIRSLLCLLYLKLFGVKISNDILSVLVAGELVHNASLLHDDVIDSSNVRRGEQTIYSKYGSRASVLSGDYILSIAIKQLLSLSNLNILNIFLEATSKMSKAEVMQFKNRNSDIEIDDYIKIIDGKTASLFSAILESVAILSDIDSVQARLFGKYFGIIFQINNDLQPDSISSDVKNGVKTARDILGIEKTLALKDNYKEKIRRVIVDIPDNEYKKGIEDLINLL